MYGRRSTEEYRVERIVGKKVRNGKVFYSVKWYGYPEEDNTWEPLDNCVKAKPLIDEFEANQQREQRNSNSKSVGRKQKNKKHAIKTSTDTNISEMSKRCEQICEFIRNVRKMPLDTSSMMNIAITDVDNSKKKELLQCSSSQIEIVGAFPSDRGPLTLGVRIKGKVENEDICNFDSTEVAMLWPYLYIAYLESRIIFR